MALSLAGAVRVPGRHRRFSLHGFDARVGGGLAWNQVVRPNAKASFGLTTAVWDIARVRSRRARVARALGLRPQFGARGAGQRGTFAMAGFRRCAPGFHSPELDRELGRFFLAPHPAHGDRTGQRPGRADRVARRTDRFRSGICADHQMGTWVAADRAAPLHASDGKRFSLELSLAAVAASGSRALRRRVAEIVRHVGAPGGKKTGYDPLYSDR